MTQLGNTVFPLPRDLFESVRTEIRPLPTAWACTYCDCVNPPEMVHCEHCGAPHIEKKKELPGQVRRRELTWAEVRQMVAAGIMTEEEASNYDPSQYEPDEDSESVIKF